MPIKNFMIIGSTDSPLIFLLTRFVPVVVVKFKVSYFHLKSLYLYANIENAYKICLRKEPFKKVTFVIARGQNFER